MRSKRNDSDSEEILNVEKSKAPRQNDMKKEKNKK